MRIIVEPTINLCIVLGIEEAKAFCEMLNSSSFTEEVEPRMHKAIREEIRDEIRRELQRLKG